MLGNVRLRLRRPSPGTLIGMIAVVAASGGVAYATIPDSGGVIHSCYGSQGADGADGAPGPRGPSDAVSSPSTLGPFP